MKFLFLTLFSASVLHAAEKPNILFIMDHGYPTGECGWWTKGTLFERSFRAPLFIAAPGVESGQTLAGASLRPLLADPRATVKDAAFTFSTNGGKPSRGIRTERRRFTQWHDGATELHNHHSDPEETRNLAAQPEHAEQVQQLHARLQTPAKLSPQTP